MFVAEVVSVSVDEAYMDKNNRFHLDKSSPICYSHGRYYALGKEVGKVRLQCCKEEKQVTVRQL